MRYRQEGDETAPILEVYRSRCLLCRGSAKPGVAIMDLDCRRFAVPKMPRVGMSFKVLAQERFVWFHVMCYKLLFQSHDALSKPTLGHLRRFADATEPRHYPIEIYGNSSSVREGLLSDFSRDILQSTFRQPLFERLPTEIQLVIADFVGPIWYLMVLGATRRLLEELRNSRARQPDCIRLAGTIHVARTVYHGRSYVSWITNDPLELSQGEEALVVPSGIKRVVLSVDHIGVLGIQFLNGDSRASSDGSPWYEILDIKDVNAEIYVQFDGIFVRSMHPKEAESVGKSLWKLPNPPILQPWNVYGHELNGLHYVRMDSNTKWRLARCNGSDVWEICSSVAALGCPQPLNIGEPLKTPRTSSIEGSSGWICIPLKAGEVIENAWVREFQDPRFRNPNLILLTSRKRLVTFGPHLPSGVSHQYAYHPLRKKGDGAISGIIHNGGCPGGRGSMTAFGVTCDPEMHAKDPAPNPPLYDYKLPADSEIYCARRFFMSRAALDNLESVRVCRDQRAAHRPCRGVLLYYKDGEIESVGRLHPSWELTPPIPAPIRIQQSTFTEHKYYVKEVATYDPFAGQLADSEWLYLPRNGTLVWWFKDLVDVVTLFDE